MSEASNGGTIGPMKSSAHLKYRYRKCCGPNFSETGHYTQMVVALHHRSRHRRGRVKQGGATYCTVRRTSIQSERQFRSRGNLPLP